MHANKLLAESMKRFRLFDYALVFLDLTDAVITLRREMRDERESD